jgi:hypothetical protein
MFGGAVKKFTHNSVATKTPMTFSVFLPNEALGGTRLPALCVQAHTLRASPRLNCVCVCSYYLSGLTCTDDNFIQKGFAQKAAAEKQLVIVAPDTRSVLPCHRRRRPPLSDPWNPRVVRAARARATSRGRTTHGISAQVGCSLGRASIIEPPL